LTSPAERVRIVCPACGHEYEALHRSSINTTLGEEWTEEDLRAATHARCPDCGLEVELATLIMEGRQPSAPAADPGDPRETPKR
jgi:DNA-directed RNA polymerase subunit RPC12/RpoP